jgi:hypothetical protein
VIIESAPAAFGSDEGPLPIDLNAAGWNQNANSFTTSGGQITNAQFFALSPDFLGDIILNFGTGSNIVTLDGGETTVEDDGGFAAVTYTSLAAAPTSAPAPASFKVGVVALPILGFWLLKKRRLAAV